MNINDRYKSEKRIILSQLHDHVRSNKLLIKKPYLLNKLKQEWGALLITALYYDIIRHCNKNKKRVPSELISYLKTTPISNYKVPIINLSDYKLSEVDRKQLQLDLEYSFVNKNRDLKKNLAVNLDTIERQTSPFVDQINLEDFHESLQVYTDIFIKKVHAALRIKSIRALKS